MSTGTVTGNISGMAAEGHCELKFPLEAHIKHRDVFAFERDFDYMPRLEWLRDNWTLSFLFVVIYLVVIVVGKRLMRDRPAFVLRWPLLIWNLGLAVMSIGGALRVTPEMFRMIRESGFTYTVCSLGSLQYMEAIGFWGFLFTWSKLWELGDTVFIVLRKQNLMFLHWYHHITVLTGVWYGAGNLNAMGRWFMATNYFVHAFMYTYYALKTLKFRVPKVVSMVITTGQILQMVMCIYVTLHVYLVKRSGGHCCVSNRTLSIGVYLYASYFLLFLHYFLQAYVFTGSRKAVKLPAKMN